MIKLLLLALLCRPLSAGDPDGLNRLETDPSPAATQELGTLYHKVKDSDQRFWLVEALGVRLKERGDEAALRMLLSAASDADPNVRGPALRALAGFGALPEAVVRKSWLARLNAAADKGVKDPAPAVRHEAADLRRALRDWRPSDPASGPTSVGIADLGGGFVGWFKRGLGLVWLLLAPLMAFFWVRGRRPGPCIEGKKSAGEKVKNPVHSDKAPAAVGPYSQAIRCGGFLFVSGQIALDPSTGNLVEGGMKEQTRQVLRNLRAILDEAGLDFRHVVKTTVYLSDMSAWSDMNSVYAESFPAPAPARAAVEVSALPKGALVEIEAVARIV